MCVRERGMWEVGAAAVIWARARCAGSVGSSGHSSNMSISDATPCRAAMASSPSSVSGHRTSASVWSPCSLLSTSRHVIVLRSAVASHM